MLALAAIAGPTTLYAQDAQRPAPPPPADSVLRFDAERISVRVPRPSLRMDGASVALLGVDSLAAPPSALLDEGLRELPLAQVRTNSRGEAHIALRGARSRQVAVLLDGVPLTIAWDHRTDLSLIPLLAIRELRLLRGPTSILHGPNVLGGVVELGLHDAPGASLPPFQASLGTDQTGARSTALQVAGRFRTGAGVWTARAGGGYRAREHAPLAEGVVQPAGRSGRRLNSDLRHSNGFLTLRYDAPGGAWAAVSAIGFQARKGVPPELHVEEPRLWRIPDVDRTVLTLGTGTGWRETPLGQGRIHATVGLDQGHVEILSYESFAYDAVEGREADADRTLSARLVGEHSLGHGAVRSALTLARTSHRERLDDGEPTLFGQRLWSLGGEVEQPLPRVDSGTWSAGIVLDGSDTNETGGREPLDRLWAWGARVGAVIPLAEGIVAHGGATRRVRFPSLAELYSAALGRFAPNPALEPEKLSMGEVGMTMQGSGWEFQAVGFHQRLADAIVRVATEDGRLMRVNRGESRSTGVELLGQNSIGRATVSGNVTIQRVRTHDPDGSEGRAEYEPELAAEGRLAVPLPLELSGETAVQFVGRQYCVVPGQNELGVLHSSTELDLGLARAWRFSSANALPLVEARFAVDNITDGAVYDQCGLPRPGRTLRIEVRLR